MSLHGKCVLFLLVASYSAFVDGQTEENMSSIDLGIKLKTEVPIMVSSPYLCPKLPEQKICQQSISIAWETPRRGDYCLWDKNNQTKLECWEQQWSGIIQIDFNSAFSITYQLRDSANTRTLAEVKVLVLEKLEQKLKRKRPFWRFF